MDRFEEQHTDHLLPTIAKHAKRAVSDFVAILGKFPIDDVPPTSRIESNPRSPPISIARFQRKVHVRTKRHRFEYSSGLVPSLMEVCEMLAIGTVGYASFLGQLALAMPKTEFQSDGGTRS